MTAVATVFVDIKCDNSVDAQCHLEVEWSLDLLNWSENSSIVVLPFLVAVNGTYQDIGLFIAGPGPILG